MILESKSLLFMKLLTFNIVKKGSQTVQYILKDLIVTLKFEIDDWWLKKNWAIYINHLIHKFRLLKEKFKPDVDELSKYIKILSWLVFIVFKVSFNITKYWASYLLFPWQKPTSLIFCRLVSRLRSNLYIKRQFLILMRWKVDQTRAKD